MSIATKFAKAKKMGVIFAPDYEPKSEEELDKVIEEKKSLLNQQKEEDRIARQNGKRAAEQALKDKVVLKDIDGDDVDQADYFFPRIEKEKIGDKEFPPTDQTAPNYFNQICGMPVDRDDLIEVFLQYFPRSKGFLFYKMRDKEVYLIIVPLKYAKTVNKANESRPGDFQRHALSFIAEGSVNIESLKLKLARIAGHSSSISTEPIAR